MSFIDEAKKFICIENGALELKTTGSPTLDLLYAIGGSRGKDIIPVFSKAFSHNIDDSIRISLWARDIREGAGERQLFKDILVFVERENIELFKKMVCKIPLLGRWDDLLVAKSEEGFAYISKIIKDKIEEDSKKGTRSLAAKWMPRRGEIAKKLRECWDLSPKSYRKYLVSNTKVVESEMCAQKWENIKFKEVPSLALFRYSNAFQKHSGDKFANYIEMVNEQEIYINTRGIYPYDMIKCLEYGKHDITNEEWLGLKNYVEDNFILPIVDASSTMDSPFGGSSSLTCLSLAISLGLYISSRQSGALKDLILWFNENPQFVDLTEFKRLKEKVSFLNKLNRGGHKNISKAFDLILSLAIRTKATQAELPKSIIIFSDMEFSKGEIENAEKNCMHSTNFEVWKIKFENAGYKLPILVFWNINSRRTHAPVEAGENGTILISGVSPTLMKFVDSNNQKLITPHKIMLGIIRNKRYDF